MAAIQKITILIMGFLLLQSFGCEEQYSDDSFLFEPPVTYDQLIKEGWIYFQAGDYETSIESFITASERDATQPEVYLGLGWGYARNVELIESFSNFQKAISFAFFDPDNETRILTESLAGLSLVSLASGNYNNCIDYADQTLQIDADFSFSKDATVDAQALKLSQAESYFYLGNIQACFNIVKELGADVGNVTDTTSSGVVSHTNKTFLTGEMIVNVAGEHQLISVTDAYKGNISYNILSVNEGTNELMITGNPIVASGDSISVSYYFTMDYANFLNKLLNTIVKF